MWLGRRHNSRTGKHCRGAGIVARAGVSEVLSQIADGVLAIPPTAFGAVGVMGLIGAALFVADPEKRLVVIIASHSVWLKLITYPLHEANIAICTRDLLAVQCLQVLPAPTTPSLKKKAISESTCIAQQADCSDQQRWGRREGSSQGLLQQRGI